MSSGSKWNSVKKRSRKKFSNNGYKIRKDMRNKRKNKKAENHE